jgi:hypothetical protein
VEVPIQRGNGVEGRSRTLSISRRVPDLFGVANVHTVGVGVRAMVNYRIPCLRDVPRG